MPTDRPVDLRPIDADDIEPVADFLTASLNSRVPADAWSNAMRLRWVDAPNHGFMLQAGDDVVGAYLAFYSEREIAGRTELFCNLGAWCVLDEYRSHGLRLVRAMLAQPGYTFTDLSPSGNVVPLNKRLRFTSLDTSATAMLNLPWPVKSRGMTITSNVAVIGRALTGHELQLFRDHAHAAAAQHVLVTDGNRACYVILRRDRRKRLPIFGSILYVGDADLFHRATYLFSRHLLVHQRVLVTLAEQRVVGRRLAVSVTVPKPRPKMFKSATVSCEQVDYLYSELTSVAW